MASIYDQHDAAFNRVSAFVVLKDGERVATVAMKFPADGAGRLYAYVHWLGLEMTRGMASGYGYDKRSAAVSDAAAKTWGTHPDDVPHEATSHDIARGAFFTCLKATGNGGSWDRDLEKAGFVVLQAV